MALAILLASLLSMLATPVAHAQSRDGWCKQGEGMAVVIDFTALSASHWPNTKGYVVRCIVNPQVPGETPGQLLQAAGIAHTGTTYIDSILGLGEGAQTFGWVRGRNLPGSLSWEGMGVQLPEPQINGFAYFYAKASINDLNSIPSVLPQFASGGGGGNGDGDGGSLVPGAPKQQDGGANGGGTQLVPQAPNQPGRPGQSGQGGQQGQTGTGNPGQPTAVASENLKPGAPSQAPTAPQSPNAAAVAAGTASQAPNDPQQSSSPPAVFSSEQPHDNPQPQQAGGSGNWLLALGGLAIIVLGVGAGFGLRALNARKSGVASDDSD